MNIILCDQVWLAANAPGPGNRASATVSYYLPDNRAHTLANISIAREISAFASFFPGASGGYDLTGSFEAYIWAWKEGGRGYDNDRLFDWRGEPSALVMENCVEVTFQLDAQNRSGIATATILQFA
jgi:hypothetical protein